MLRRKPRREFDVELDSQISLFGRFLGDRHTFPFNHFFVGWTDDGVYWDRQIPSIEGRQLHGVTCKSFHKRDLLSENKIIAIPLEDTVRFLVDDENEICGYKTSLFISLLRKSYFRSLLPTWPDLNR